MEKPGCATSVAALPSIDRGFRKGCTISTSLSPGSAFGSDKFAKGAIPGSGTFFCLGCGSQLSLRESDHLPECPRCGGSSFRRDSIFESMQDHSGTTAEYAIPIEVEAPTWLDEARASLGERGRFLACREDSGAMLVFPVATGWMRIGRSIAADVRLDDPSVSRRHALLVSEPGEDLRVLDDRSLNGVFVNGKMAEWETLRDGDELTIGRYHLFILEG